MKILFIHSELGMLAGGGENFTRNLMKALMQRGNSITVVFTAHMDGTVLIPIPPDVKAVPLCGLWNRQLGQQTLVSLSPFFHHFQGLQPIWTRLQLSMAGRAISWHNKRFLKRVLRHMEKYWTHYDVAYVHGKPQLATEISLKLPTCIRLPGPIGQDDIEFMQKVQIICANGDALQKTQQMLGDKKQVYELPAGLDLLHFTFSGDNFRSRLLWAEKDIVIGYVGRMTVLKGVRFLVEAFCEIAQRFPFIRLLLVGAGEEIPGIRKIIKKAGINNQVFFSGIQTHEILPAWYRTMDLFVMPSLYENFSNSLLEAMGCSLPVIVSKVGGNPMMVTENKNGWLFLPGNKDELVSILESAIRQRGQWQSMGQLSRTIVEKNFDWGHTAEVFEKLMHPYLLCQHKK